MIRWKKCENELPEDLELRKTHIYPHVFCLTKGYYSTKVLAFNLTHQCWDDADADDYYCGAVDGLVLEWVKLDDLIASIEDSE